jgi:uncharacterized protein YjbJ (UPF0337 family)
MSDSEGGKLDEMTSRIKFVGASAESHLDADGLMHRIQEAIGKVSHTLDSDSIMGRFKEVAGQAEGKIDASKLRQRAADVDRDKLKGLLDEAQHLGTSAVSYIGTQGEKLVDRAPGAFDKLTGAAKERLETLTGAEGLISDEQLEWFKGPVKETIVSVSELAESRSKDAAEMIKSKLDEETRRN